MSAEKLKRSEVAGAGFMLSPQEDGIALAIDDVLAALEIKGFPSQLELLALLEVLDRLLDADGDEQANYDGCDVNEKVAPGVGGVVRRVDVEHLCSSHRRGGLIVRQVA